MAAQQNYSEIVKKAKEYLNVLRKAHIPFDHAYIYGSHVKGTATHISDIDLAVIAEDWTPDIIHAQAMLLKAASLIDDRIEPHPFRTADFDMTNPSAREILVSGDKLILLIGLPLLAVSVRRVFATPDIIHLDDNCFLLLLDIPAFRQVAQIDIRRSA